MNFKWNFSFLFLQSITIFGFLILYTPLIVLAIESFHTAPYDYSQGWTLKWYQKLLCNEEVWEAFFLSLSVGFWSTLGATLLGTAAALSLKKMSHLEKRGFEILNYISLSMPEIVLGLALLVWFSLIKITLGTISIILAHMTFSVSYVILTIRARIADLDEYLEEAALDLGANSWEVFWKVTFPLVRPGILSGALIAFTLSFDDFLVSFFIAGVGSNTLPLQIYSMIRYGVSPEINALSTLLIFSTFLIVLMLFQLLRKKPFFKSEERVKKI